MKKLNKGNITKENVLSKMSTVGTVGMFGSGATMMGVSKRDTSTKEKIYRGAEKIGIVSSIVGAIGTIGSLIVDVGKRK